MGPPESRLRRSVPPLPAPLRAGVGGRRCWLDTHVNRRFDGDGLKSRLRASDIILSRQMLVAVTDARTTPWTRHATDELLPPSLWP